MTILELSILTFFQSFELPADSLQFEKVKEFPLSFNYQQSLTDPLGNAYFIQDEILIKHMPGKNKKISFSNSEFGTISLLDVSDPMKLLLYYKDYNMILFLDNNLSELLSPISLDDLGHENVRLACSSREGSFWIYDEQSGQLFSYNENLHLTNKSISIHSITEGEIEPNLLLERGEKVYLNIPDFGILVFNHLGGYLHTIPLINLETFQIDNQKVVYYNEHTVFEYSPFTQETTSFDIPDTTNVTHSTIHKDQLYIFHKDHYQIYQIKK